MRPPDPVDRFHATLSGSVQPGLLAVAPDEVAPRVAVYRNNVAHSLKAALARRYPVVERLVGLEFFAAMASLFIANHPPMTPVLQEWGQDFAGFLAQFPPVAGLPYLPDVARLEWLRGEAYHAADATFLPPARLSPDTPLHLHPSLRLLRSAWPVVGIWQANQPGRDGRCSEDEARIALIWRGPDFEVPVVALRVEDADTIEALLRGSPLSDAVRSSDPVPLLTLLLRNQLICDGGYP
ncbi:DNA-binding domain-containing protein [Frigidibacter sp. MR17.14]|uniref:HvfC/BufC N-terminal domain-containing protein n=1 Tax=Frigidibacter sp. MR17.14 TaxID=3126509 RepID=UPI003012CE48